MASSPERCWSPTAALGAAGVVSDEAVLSGLSVDGCWHQSPPLCLIFQSLRASTGVGCVIGDRGVVPRGARTPPSAAPYGAAPTAPRAPAPEPAPRRGRP